VHLSRSSLAPGDDVRIDSVVRNVAIGIHLRLQA
jgi:hypothetical protein